MRLPRQYPATPLPGAFFTGEAGANEIPLTLQFGIILMPSSDCRLAARLRGKFKSPNIVTEFSGLADHQLQFCL